MIAGFNLKTLKFSIFFLISFLGYAQNDSIPFKVDPLFDFNKPETLGLPIVKNKETITIFSPHKNANKYNHGVVLFPFKNMLYAQWQSSSIDEDGPDTQIFYAQSKNGKNWSKPIALTSIYENGIKTSGGWWSDGETLIAYICVWPNADENVKEGYTEYRTSINGTAWTSPKKVKNKEGQPVLGIIEQDIHKLPNGRIITAFHMQPGLIVTPFFTDDPLGVLGWTAGTMKNLPSDKNMSRELEPSWFYRKKDSAVVMIFRDQQSTFKKLASVSFDNGNTWTTPQIVDTPDSRAKQSAGNLPNGTAFMVNNPSGNKNRFPLAITLSKDGFVFDTAYLLRSGEKSDLQPLRFKGKYKRIGYSYPKSVIWNNYLYVSYATNKEDVELTRIPINSLEY
ncbi:sialidase family protein [Lutibacter maritimus]|uniref:BNR repeat-like domain-containing protein n=1 Tax=Lutibacter maritimus TaxID=593133 RepID=A0A1I6PH36_9FLAO|nr:sialidase family protein [Lutibacter maritimus]SFS39496.1 BNR repeat-like domain-containing protein [Lutibacter maritimus]